MKVLITGAKGMLGRNFKIKMPNVKCIETDADTMDITNEEATSNRIEEEKPDFVIHCAAYTKVDQAEEERELCYKINVIGTENVARVSDKVGATLIYISTDFVFNGSPLSSRAESAESRDPSLNKQRDSSASPESFLGSVGMTEKSVARRQTPYSESDQPHPLNYYGETKLLGEKAVEKICKKYYIIRTAWLFGELPATSPGSNFVETMLRLAKDRDEISVVSDQIGSPTYTGDLTVAIKQIIEKPIPYGIYHFSGEGETSWHGFAKKIFEQTGVLRQGKGIPLFAQGSGSIGMTKQNRSPNIPPLSSVIPSEPRKLSGEAEGSLNYKLKTLKPIPSSEYKSRAKRPPYSYLSKEKIKSHGVKIRPWQEMLTEYLSKRG